MATSIKKVVYALLVALLLGACSDEEDATPQAQEPSTTVKVQTAREFIEGFKRSNLPVGKVVCFTDETDPNELLGRPGGYIEKCDWSDKREQPTTQPTTPQGEPCSDPDIDPLDKELCDNATKEEVDLIGGSIETFETPGGATERASLLHGFEGPSALSTGYTFQPRDAIWVLRVDRELTKAQAEGYLKAFLAQL